MKAVTAMGLTYFKRYRMEIDLDKPIFAAPSLPDDYQLLQWDPSTLEVHADAKYRSFAFEIDANVFPCLGEREGCSRLMTEITRREGFCAESTWLLNHVQNGEVEGCGTIQGIRDRYGFGAVQNLGITPSHRGLGLGTVLLYKALEGFRRVGLRRSFLEVTAQNSGALRLYQRLGFRRVKTVYKAAEIAYV